MTQRDNDQETPTRTTYACAGCGEHIDGDEIKRRTKEGWLPYHPVCAPEEDAVSKTPLEQHGGASGFTIRSHCGPADRRVWKRLKIWERE